MQELDTIDKHSNPLTKTVRLRAVMRWVPTHQQWFMYDAANNKFIIRFFECENTSRFFPGMQKGKDNVFELEIRPTQA